MFTNGHVSEQQKRVIILCLPKIAKPHKPTDFRPITLLNTDCKILARIIACRLRTALGEPLRPSQYCGRQGNTIFDTVATVRDAIAYAEVARIPLCVLSLDFKEASDRIAHKYFFAIVQSYGFSDAFVERIKRMYTNAKSVVQINGHIFAPSRYGAQSDRDAP